MLLNNCNSSGNHTSPLDIGKQYTILFENDNKLLELDVLHFLKHYYILWGFLKKINFINSTCSIPFWLLNLLKQGCVFVEYLSVTNKRKIHSFYKIFNSQCI